MLCKSTLLCLVARGGCHRPGPGLELPGPSPPPTACGEEAQKGCAVSSTRDLPLGLSGTPGRDSRGAVPSRPPMPEAGPSLGSLDSEGFRLPEATLPSCPERKCAVCWALEHSTHPACCHPPRGLGSEIAWSVPGVAGKGRVGPPGKFLKGGVGTRLLPGSRVQGGGGVQAPGVGAERPQQRTDGLHP